MTAGFWTNRRVFITGHTGFKGAWLSIWLKELGANVTGYAREPTTVPSLFAAAGLAERIDKSHLGEIRELGRLRAALQESGAEVVFHLAAQPLVRDSYRDPVGTYETNVMGTVNLLEAARSCESVRAIVNVTTDKVYENKESVQGYREDERLGGYDPYSNSKACSELVTASYRDSFFNPQEHEKHGVAIATARSGNVIGGGDWSRDRLVPDCIRAFQKREQVCIRSPGSTRPWQHVLEPLAGYLTLARRLCETGPEFSGAWNFGPDSEDAASVADVVQRLVGFWGDAASFRLDSAGNPHETGQLRLDAMKARLSMGWAPRLRIDAALALTVSWYKSFAAGGDAHALCRSQLQEYGDPG